MEELEFFEDVFEQQYCHWLLEDSRKALASSSEFGRSNYQWEPHVVGSSQPVLIRDYDPLVAKFILAKLRDRGMIDSFDFSVANFAWSRLSYIPWHDDGHRKTAITIYLNEQWDKNWGGLFLYKHPRDGDLRALKPRFNCGLRNSSNLQHATSMVTMDAPEPRFTVQIFSHV